MERTLQVIEDMTRLSAEIAFRKKRERRRQLAKLPFEKKIEIVVELQKIAAGVPGARPRPIWPIPKSD